MRAKGNWRLPSLAIYFTGRAIAGFERCVPGSQWVRTTFRCVRWDQGTFRYMNRDPFYRKIIRRLEGPLGPGLV